MTAYIVGYLITAITVFIFCLPAIVLFVILLLAAGVLRVLVWPLELLIRKLRRHPKETQTDPSWLLGSSLEPHTSISESVSEKEENDEHRTRSGIAS
jgi:hypothetical protein